MSYHIYQTEAFIIEANNIGESNKLYTLFTKDLGLIRASAQGVRLLKSKLRYSLQELSFSTLAVVRGKEMWRITSARKLISLFDKRLPLSLRKMLARLLMFIKRLMPEEGKHEEIFKMISSISGLCFNSRDLFTVDQPKYIEAVEAVAKLYILKVLGYGTSRPELIDDMYEIEGGVLLKPTEDVQRFLEKVVGHLADAQAEIDRALTDSHL